MRQLVVEGELVEGLEVDEMRLVLRQHTAGNRGQDGVILGAHDILQQHLLRTLFLAHSLVVGKVEGDRLNPGTRIAGGEELIHDPDR